jgi:hypothetical protein
MTEQDRFEEFLRTSINELDPMPRVPREEMWSQIEAARRFRRPRTRGTPRTAWFAWGAALAAMLVLGIGLGRLSMVRQQATTPSVAQTTPIQRPVTVVPTADADAAHGYQLATQAHLGRVEVLLTAVNSGSIDAQVSSWAKDMLSSTRMLLASPAANDPRTAQLLEDLELVLTQIASPGARSGVELDLIQHGIKHTDVLPRVRAALPADMRAVGI